MASPSAAAKGGTDTPFTRGTMARVLGLVRGVADGAWNGWFGPGTPLTPMAPPDVGGRQFDFPVGINLTTQPRTEQGQNAISMAALRRLADPAQGGLDIVRLLIQKKKSQFVGQKWSIRGREKNNDGGKKARELETLFRRPDGVKGYTAWLKAFLEDHYVIDAPTIYFGPRNASGKLEATGLLELVDGATIKLLVDEDGRTPLPPLPTYQQVLHGIPASDLYLDQIGQYISNPRTDRIYGMSNVEQMLGIIIIALNRQLQVLTYYTEGTVPDAFVTAPDTWNPDQIAAAQQWLDSILSGQTGERRKVRFMPGKISETKAELLKNEFDEWLARIACYCFDESPQAFVKQMNRATSETAKEAAQEQGLEPEKLWFKESMDDVLSRLGATELEWTWQDEEIVDPQVKATVAVVLRGGTAGTAKPVITLAEQRDMMGLPPASPKDLEELQPPEPTPTDPNAAPGDATQLSDKENAKAGAKGEPVGKAARGRSGRSLPRLERNAALHRLTQLRIENAARAALTAQRNAVAAAFRGGTTKLAKVDQSEIEALLTEISDDAWADDIRAHLEAAIQTLATDRSDAAIRQVEAWVDEGRYAAALSQANENSVAWASARVGNLVTEVSDTTRDGINALVSQAIDEGLTNDEIADLLSSAYEFSDGRALMIARTETALAETQGTLIGYKASGVVTGKEWTADGEACDECAALDGVVVPLDDDFPDDGGDGPPLHPNCECGIAPVVDAEDDA